MTQHKSASAGQSHHTSASKASESKLPEGLTSDPIINKMSPSDQKAVAEGVAEGVDQKTAEKVVSGTATSKDMAKAMSEMGDAGIIGDPSSGADQGDGGDIENLGGAGDDLDGLDDDVTGNN